MAKKKSVSRRPALKIERATKKSAPAKKASAVARKKSAAPARGAAAKKSAAPTRSAKAGKYVYFFGNGKADGDRTMKDLLGGKGSGLAEMTSAGLPVPPGFTVSTEACTLYYKLGRKVPANVDQEMLDSLR